MDEIEKTVKIIVDTFIYNDIRSIGCQKIESVFFFCWFFYLFLNVLLWKLKIVLLGNEVERGKERNNK